MTNRPGEIVFRGTLWFLTGSATRTIVGFGLSIFLARMLPEGEFPTAVIILSLLAIFQIFSEFGVAIALIQRQVLSLRVRDNAFYLSISIAVFLCLLLFLTRDVLAESIRQPQLRELIPMLAGVLILRTVYSVYRALMMREYSFRSIAIYEFFSYILYGVTAAGLVIGGVGVQSVLIGQIFSSLILVIISAFRSKVFPCSAISIDALLELSKFGSWIAVNKSFTQAAGHLDRFLVSALVSPIAMAGYYIAHQLAVTIPGVISGSVEQTTISVYSRAQDDRKVLVNQYWRTLRVSMIIIVPIVVIPAGHANVMIPLLYGDSWSFAIEIYQILSGFALAGAMGGGVFSSLLYATGKTREVVLTGLFRLVVLPCCILGGSVFGITGVAWGLVVFGVIGRVFNQLILHFALGISFLHFIRLVFPILCSGIILGAVCWNQSSNIFEAMLMACAQLVFWFFAMRIIAKADLKFFLQHFAALISFRR